MLGEEGGGGCTKTIPYVKQNYHIPFVILDNEAKIVKEINFLLLIWLVNNLVKSHEIDTVQTSIFKWSGTLIQRASTSRKRFVTCHTLIKVKPNLIPFRSHLVYRVCTIAMCINSLIIINSANVKIPKLWNEKINHQPQRRDFCPIKSTSGLYYIWCMMMISLLKLKWSIPLQNGLEKWNSMISLSSRSWDRDPERA